MTSARAARGGWFGARRHRVMSETTLRPPITSLKLATLLLLADGLTMMPLVIAAVVLTDRSWPVSLRLGGHPRPTRRSPWVNEYP